MTDQVEEIVEEVIEALEEVIEEIVEEVDVPVERSMEVQHRSMAAEMSPISEESRTVHIALSSEEPVERSFGKEILDHSAESIDLSFIASGRAPLLLDHDPLKQIGVIESVELDKQSRRLRAKVRLERVNSLVKHFLM